MRPPLGAQRVRVWVLVSQQPRASGSGSGVVELGGGVLGSLRGCGWGNRGRRFRRQWDQQILPLAHG